MPCVPAAWSEAGAPVASASVSAVAVRSTVRVGLRLAQSWPMAVCARRRACGTGRAPAARSAGGGRAGVGVAVRGSRTAPRRSSGGWAARNPTDPLRDLDVARESAGGGSCRVVVLVWPAGAAAAWAPEFESAAGPPLVEAGPVLALQARWSPPGAGAAVAFRRLGAVASPCGAEEGSAAAGDRGVATPTGRGEEAVERTEEVGGERIAWQSWRVCHTMSPAARQVGVQ